MRYRGFDISMSRYLDFSIFRFLDFLSDWCDEWVNPRLWVVAEIAGRADVAGSRVGIEAVGLPKVPADGIEPLSVGSPAEVYVRNPFHSVTPGRGEQQLRLEVGVVRQQLPDAQHLGSTAEMVEVHAYQPRWHQQTALLAVAELSAEGAVGQSLTFECLLCLRVGNAS